MNLSENVLVRISITQQDINEGTARSCRSCPGALAIRRKLPDNITVEVGSYTTHFHGIVHDEFDGRYVSTDRMNPVPLRAFVDWFDNNMFVKPIQFNMYVPKALYFS